MLKKILRQICYIHFLIVEVDVIGDPFFTAAASHRPTMKKHHTARPTLSS